MSLDSLKILFLYCEVSRHLRQLFSPYAPMSILWLAGYYDSFFAPNSVVHNVLRG
jgi:hypothetical protein